MEYCSFMVVRYIPTKTSFVTSLLSTNEGHETKTFYKVLIFTSLENISLPCSVSILTNFHYMLSWIGLRVHCNPFPIDIIHWLAKHINPASSSPELCSCPYVMWRCLIHAVSFVNRKARIWTKLTGYQHHYTFANNYHKQNVIPKGLDWKFNLALDTNNCELYFRRNCSALYSFVSGSPQSTT